MNNIFDKHIQEIENRRKRDNSRKLADKIQREILYKTTHKLLLERNPVSLEVISEEITIQGVPPLYDFQRHTLNDAVHSLGRGHSRILIAPTGSGKTFFTGYLLRALRKCYPERYPENEIILMVTKPSIITQTQRVIIGSYKNKNAFITSYPQMVSSLGQIFIEWGTRITNGQPILFPFWRVKPTLFIGDEIQSAKNESSQTTDIIMSLAETNTPAFVMSATPYSRPVHTRAVVCLLKPISKFGWNEKMIIGPKEFPSWVKEISAPSSELDWCPAAMARINKVLEPHILRFGKLSYAKRTIIKQVTCNFDSPQSARIYKEAFEEYQRKRMEFGSNPLVGFAEVLVAILKFRQKAELLRANQLAELAFEMEKEKNISPIIACAFQDTLKVIHARLIKLGVKEDEISVIIGNQSMTERQTNIDNFQLGKTRFMLLMFAAGGAGLSLHHYKPTQRPRTVFLPPVWSAEELVQVLGRAHRINSISTTYQYIMWFNGTIETQVMERVKRKCSALKEAVGKKEAWVEAFDTEYVAQKTKQVKNTEEPKHLNESSDEDEDSNDEIPIETE